MQPHSSQPGQSGWSGIHPQWVDALAHYRAIPPAYDELLHDGEVRAHWLPLLRQPLDPARRAPSASDGAPDHRHDALPFIIAAKEWRTIEAGLEQRARLLNAINLDFYGKQSLLRERGLPPALVFANPRYLPACRPGFAANGAALGLLAFDLGRAPDGGWRVLANHTETPTGLGLALENRIHTASLLPAAVQQAAMASVRDVIQGFASELRQRGQATGTSAESLCVLLAGDATQPDYADWKALGEHLGCPLLEGSDLVVRGGRVFARTLNGLKPVAAVLRLVASNGSDPLTLSPTSLAGTPGLLNAATERGVAVINPIGSGAVDSDALNPFLPGLSQHLLDEPLLLPSLATWWCGQPREAAAVSEQFDQLAIGPAFGRPCGLDGDPAKPETPAGASSQTAIQAQPYRFSGREPLRPSIAPGLTEDGQLKPAPVTLRLFVVATPSGYRVLPGGLARTASGSSTLIKDVWIAETGLAHTHTGTVDEGAPPEPSQAPLMRDIKSGGSSKPAMTSAAAETAILTRRTGDDLFWFGRYLERAQTSVRVFTALGHLIAEGQPLSPEVAQVLLQLLTTLGFTATTDDRTTAALDERRLCRLLFDASSDDALVNLLERLRLTGTRRRETLPVAAWQAIASIHQAQQSRWRARNLADALGLLDGLALQMAAVSGLLDETQLRDQGFWLQRLGKHIERLRLLAAINIAFRVTPAPMDPYQLRLLAQLHNLAENQAAWAVEAGAPWQRLVCDADHPKSMRHQAERIVRCLERLAPPGSSTGLTEARNCAHALNDELAEACCMSEIDDSETRRLLNSANARAVEISAHISAMWSQSQTVQGP